MVEIHVLKTKTCPSCLKVTTVIKKVADGMKGISVKETYLDSGPEGQKLALKYHVMSVPTIVIGGKVAFVGTPTESALRSAIERELRS